MSAPSSRGPLPSIAESPQRSAREISRKIPCKNVYGSGLFHWAEKPEIFSGYRKAVKGQPLRPVMATASALWSRAHAPNFTLSRARFDSPPHQVGQYVAGRHTERVSLPRSTQQRVSQSAATEHSRAQLMVESIVVQIDP
jgi:hypothetical protein